MAVLWLLVAIAVVVAPVLFKTDEPGMVLLAPMPLAGAWFASRWARGAWAAEVTILPEEVVVRGPWKTRRFPLADAQEFAPGLQPFGQMNPTPGVLLKLTDGPRFRSGRSPQRDSSGPRAGGFRSGRRRLRL
jgi:hypothetical protein